MNIKDKNYLKNEKENRESSSITKAHSHLLTLTLSNYLNLQRQRHSNVDTLINQVHQMNHCAELSTSVSTFKASTQSEWAKDEGNYPCGKKGGKKSHAEQKYCAEILKNSSNSQIDRPARSQIILTGEVISLTFLQVCKRVRDIGTNNDDNQFSVQAFSPYVWAGFFFLHNAERALLISIHILR